MRKSSFLIKIKDNIFEIQLSHLEHFCLKCKKNTSENLAVENFKDK